MKRLVIIMISLMALLQANDLNLCFTGNNRGLLGPCGCKIPAGGYGRIATAAKMIKGEYIQIGTGNHFFHHTPIVGEDQFFEQKKADFQAGLMSKLNYKVVNVGQFDLCYGINPLLQIHDKHRLDLISANLTDKNGIQVFPSYKIIEQKGLKIMFIGICLLSDGFNFKIKDPLKRLVELKEEGIFEKADLVILLADAPAFILSDFAKKYSGIDLIIASKDHRFTSLPFQYESTALVELGSQGKYMGILKLHYKDLKKEWKDISVYDYYVKSSESKLHDSKSNKKRNQRQLKSHSKKLRSIKKDHPEHYTWEMLFLDDSIGDNITIKDQIEIFSEKK